jgi:hypothetical protein
MDSEIPDTTSSVSQAHEMTTQSAAPTFGLSTPATQKAPKEAFERLTDPLSDPAQFILFSKLPIEVRLMIWRFTFPPERKVPNQFPAPLPLVQKGSLEARQFVCSYGEPRGNKETVSTLFYRAKPSFGP